MSKVKQTLFLTGFVACQDTDLSEGEASFESEFHVKYGNKEDEKKAGWNSFIKVLIKILWPYFDWGALF